MIRAIIDTNVFISGTMWIVTPHKILELWSASKFKLVVSGEILNEYELVLHNFLNHQPELISQIIETIRINSEFVQPVKFPKPICRDPNDEMFLTAAVAGKINYIVSGDKDLLVLDKIFDFKIISPRQFLDIILDAK